MLVQWSSLDINAFIILLNPFVISTTLQVMYDYTDSPCYRLINIAIFTF